MLDAGTIGAIVGSTLGIAGGVFGTWMSIRNTRAGDQKRFIIKAAIIAWLGVLLFVALLLALPSPWKWLLCLLYVPLLLLFIVYINRSMAKMQCEG